MHTVRQCATSLQPYAYRMRVGGCTEDSVATSICTTIREHGSMHRRQCAGHATWQPVYLTEWEHAQPEDKCSDQHLHNQPACVEACAEDSVATSICTTSQYTCRSMHRGQCAGHATWQPIYLAEWEHAQRTGWRCTTASLSTQHGLTVTTVTRLGTKPHRVVVSEICLAGTIENLTTVHCHSQEQRRNAT